MPSAKGLLVLCNTGNGFLQPDVIAYGLHHILGQNHKSIDWMIYMTYGLPVQISGMPEPGDLFTQPTRQGFQPMPSDFFDKISETWMKYISHGTVVREYIGIDHRALFGVEHVHDQS